MHLSDKIMVQFKCDSDAASEKFSDTYKYIGNSYKRKKSCQLIIFSAFYVRDEETS